MKITIHRGTDQIGGCVTEYEHEGWKLFVDYGEQLPGSPKSKPLDIDGLTKGDVSKSALLITHYHGDHIGCIKELPKELPLYIGKLGRDIQLALSEHLSYVDENQDMVIERLNTSREFSPGQLFSIGPFNVMPVTIDHSAFDAYAFKIEADGVSIFHTGDFRTHGFRSKKLKKMLEQYVGKVDYVVCEGTNVSRPDSTSCTEAELQKTFQNALTQKIGHIVYLSSTNIDRLFSFYHAALRAGMPFIVDAYQKQVMDIVAKSDSLWSKSKLYRYGEYEPLTLFRKGNDFAFNDKFVETITKKGYVLIARANPKFDKLINELPGEKKKYLSMWQGYLDERKEAYHAALAKALKGGYEYLHTSGHCDIRSMKNLFQLLHPKAIIPIHTDSPDKFTELFCEEWPVIRLHDGESIMPISSSTADSCGLSIFCTKELNDGTTCESREDGEETYGLDAKYIGPFKSLEATKFVLEHTLYRQTHLVGYDIEDTEDLSPSKVHTFDADKNLLATYTHGGHQPGGGKYQEACRFAPGEKVLAVFHAPYYAVVPVKVIGPMTLESERESWELNDPKVYYDSYEDYVKDWDDWHWDSVAVHPLAKLKSYLDRMANTVVVPRIYLFPYQKYEIKDEDPTSV